MCLRSLLNGPLGFGATSLGNMFRNIPQEEALETVEEAWKQGVRYFDTAPFFDAGLSEIRLGEALSQHPRVEYVLSTKVGRVILDEIEDVSVRDLGEKGGVFAYGRPNRIVNDYSADATLRSFEDSLKRMKTDYIEIVWVHDVAQDFYGDDWLSVFEAARKGAFRALTRLREEGVIKAWGLGVNRVEPCELTLDLVEPQPDGFLLAGPYSLLDHVRALQRLMPVAAARKVDIVAGGPYSSGVLAGGAELRIPEGISGDHREGGAHQGHRGAPQRQRKSGCVAVRARQSGRCSRDSGCEPSRAYRGRSGCRQRSHSCLVLARST